MLPLHFAAQMMLGRIRLIVCCTRLRCRVLLARGSRSEIGVRRRRREVGLVFQESRLQTQNVFPELIVLVLQSLVVLLHGLNVLYLFF